MSRASLLLLLGVLACAPPPRPPVPWAPIPTPPADEVETILLLVGDAGEALPGASPTLARVREEVETWSGLLAHDSAVVVLYLGDIVYPVGVRPAGTPEHAEDVRHVLAQVEVVTGPLGSRHGARAYFVAGNHDWGLAEGIDGVQRLRNLDDYLERLRIRGAAVELTPPPGEPGPVVVDLGEHVRMVLFDSAWWLLGPDATRQDRMIHGIHEALAGAGSRHTILASHHPWESAGSHAGLVSFWETLGLRMLLSRSGALLQDLDSGPYRRMRDRMRRVFSRTGPPLIFAGGHDHSLQALAARDSLEPRYMLLSGSASKITEVGWTEGMDFAAAKPGYIRLMVRKDGGIDMFIEATHEDYLHCPEAGEEREACMEAGRRAFGTVFSAHLEPTTLGENLAPAAGPIETPDAPPDTATVRPDTLSTPPDTASLRR